MIKEFFNCEIYNSKIKEISDLGNKKILLFPLGYTVGIDIKKQQNRIKQIIMLDFSNTQTSNYTTYKDFI